MPLDEIGPVGTRAQEILKGLDDQQRELVTTIEGPVLGVAGPGAGKTTAMTRRVAYMIDRGIPPTSILLLTFTRAAAASMLQRARALAPEAALVHGGTFHHVAAGLLRDACGAFGLPPNFTVMDPADCHDAVAACIAGHRFPAKGNRPRARTVHAVISYMANTRCDLDDAVERRAADWREHAEWFGRIREAYVDYKVGKALVDYDDLLLYFAALANDPGYGPQVRARWPYVLVDEHQDSNPLQMDIVLGLGGEDGNVMVIGDPSQSIYGFRGAAPRAMFAIRERWPHARIVLMETNYRSTERIVAVVNAVDRHMPERFERSLRSLKGAKGEKPRLVVCQDDRHQAEEVCARILAEKEEGVPLHDQAILVRSSWAARSVEFELLAQRIPYRFVGGLRIDEAAHVKDLLSLARVADNPKHELAWVRVLTLLEGLGEVGARKLLPGLTAAEGPDGILAAFDRTAWPRRVEPAPLRAALAAMLAPGALSGRLEAAVGHLEPCLARRYKDDWRDRRRDLEAVADVADNHDGLTAFLESVTIDYSMDGRQRAAAAEAEEERPITLSTIHSAKGLEWATVHIPGLTAGHLPSFFSYGDEEGMAEELRVFYVAVSRAKRRLTLYRPALTEKGIVREASPYLDMMRRLIEEAPPLVDRGRASIRVEADRVLDRRAILLGRR